MYKGVLLAFSRWTLPVPPSAWRRQMVKMERYIKSQLAFMTDDHRKVHNYAVSRLIEAGCPCTTGSIAGRLGLTEERVKTILDDIEKNTNLVSRDAGGNITQAYPVTLRKTPLRMVISIGRELYAGEPMGALAIPLVQKRISGIPITGHITTECAQCKLPLHFLVDSDASARAVEEKPDPVIFIPAPGRKTIFADLAGRFLEESLFFCSPEHAAAYRKKNGGARGAFLPLKQAANVNRILQKEILGISG